MLAKGAGQAVAWHCDNALLPFLYRTKTIQQRTYTRLSRGTTVSRRDDGTLSRQDGGAYANPRIPRGPPIGADPFERTPKDELAKRDEARNTGWRQLDLNNERGRGERTETRRGVMREPRDRREPRERREPWERRDPKDSRGSRERVSDHVPFEKASDAQAAEAPDVDLDDSTITPSERKAFEKLFSLRKEKEANSNKEAGATGRGTVKKPDRELGLDAILDAAVENLKPRERPKPQFPAALVPMAEEARERQRAVRGTPRGSSEVRRDENIRRDLKRVTALMNKAQTDVELWNILNEHVLNRVAALELDPITTPKQRAAAEAWLRTQTRLQSKEDGNPAQAQGHRSSVDNLTIMTENLTKHLLHFMHLLQSSFPGSLLSLSLLPTLKKLGPSAFALGTNTALYNAHMHALYAKYGPGSLHSIAEILGEMDREVYEFDEGTLGFLLRVLEDARGFRKGDGGSAVQALWSAEGAGRGLRELGKWSKRVESRRQEVALRRVREDEMLREAGIEEVEDDEQGRGKEAAAVAFA